MHFSSGAPVAYDSVDEMLEELEPCVRKPAGAY
jgi:hypothetical protein